jgi:hypothetical protein
LAGVWVVLAAVDCSSSLEGVSTSKRCLPVGLMGAATWTFLVLGRWVLPGLAGCVVLATDCCSCLEGASKRSLACARARKATCWEGWAANESGRNGEGITSVIISPECLYQCQKHSILMGVRIQALGGQTAGEHIAVRGCQGECDAVKGQKVDFRTKRRLPERSPAGACVSSCLSGPKRRPFQRLLANVVANNERAAAIE